MRLLAAGLVHLMTNDLDAVAAAPIVVASEPAWRAPTAAPRTWPSSSSDTRRWRAGISALRRSGSRVVVLKRGGEGAVLLDGDRLLEVPPVRMEVVNGLGAGDGFLAALTRGVLHGIDLATAVRRSNWAGAYVAS